MTKTLSEILGFGQPTTPMSPAEKAAEREQKKKQREEKKEQEAATREKRQTGLKKQREAEKAAKSIRHDDRKENRDKARLDRAAQNARGAAGRANAMKNRQTRTGGVSTRSTVRRNKALTKYAAARTATAYQTAANSAKYHQDRVKANLQIASMEYDMSTVEIISESCMVGLNEDMYFKVKIEGLPTMYVNSANREELRKDLVGLLRNPSKAVGDIKRVTPQEVKKRLRLRSQGKEEEEMNESSVTRNRIANAMDKASGRNQKDRIKDAQVATKARQDSEKDLAAFRKKNAKVLQSSVSETREGMYYDKSNGKKMINADAQAGYEKAQIDKMKYVSKGFPGRKEAERHNDKLVGSGKASHKSYVHNHKDGKFYVVDMNEVLTSTSADSIEKLSPDGKFHKKRVTRRRINAQTATESVMVKLQNHYKSNNKDV